GVRVAGFEFEVARQVAGDAVGLLLFLRPPGLEAQRVGDAAVLERVGAADGRRERGGAEYEREQELDVELTHRWSLRRLPPGVAAGEWVPPGAGRGPRRVGGVDGRRGGERCATSTVLRHVCGEGAEAAAPGAAGAPGGTAISSRVRGLAG